MPVYTVIGGVNGAGKSSFTGSLRCQQRDLGPIVDVDKLIAGRGGGAIAGAKAAIRKIEDCLRRRVSFAQETTLSGRKTPVTARRAKEAGYFVRLYYIGLDGASEHIQRIANRVTKGGHDIPAADVMRRYAGRIDALLAVLPYCDEAVFFDNDNGFREVAEYLNGEIIPKGDYRPRWLAELTGRHRDG